MNAELRIRLARRIIRASRRLAESDALVKVGEADGRRVFRSVLADGPAHRLEAEAVAAVNGDDARAAWTAVEKLERTARRAMREAGRRRGTVRP